MKSIKVPFYGNSTRDVSIKGISALLDKEIKHTLDYTPWSESKDKTSVSFSILHTADSINLKYYVTEEHLRIHYFTDNDPVYKDSCVEFFISLNGEKEYYNFEFNSIGNCLAEYGPDRYNRKRLPLSIIEQIKHKTMINRESIDNQINWELTLAIPVSVFCHHRISSLKGMNGAANLHKCGDDLPKPHYLCWSNIESPAPDFHLRSFFGNIEFEK